MSTVTAFGDYIIMETQIWADTEYVAVVETVETANHLYSQLRAALRKINLRDFNLMKITSNSSVSCPGCLEQTDMDKDAMTDRHLSCSS